jgi:phenylacetate-CoA ligase
LSTFTIEQLRSIPVLTKTDVRNDPEAFRTNQSQRYDSGFTSGSTDRLPTKIYLDRDLRVTEIAFLHHIWSRVGFRVGDKRAILRDYGGNVATRKKSWRYDSPLRELWLSPFHLTAATMDRYLELLREYRVRYLYGVPSGISILANHALAVGWCAPPSLRGVITASERLFSHQRRLIGRSFGVPVLSSYGLTERVAIGGELVDSPDTYEFEPLYGITELVDETGKPIDVPGKQGRLVSTGLVNAAMALIRYDTGDRATLVEDATRENRYRLRVRNITSRWNQEFLIGHDNQQISIIDLDPDDNRLLISEYQYVQTDPGRAIFRVVPRTAATSKDLKDLLANLQRPVRGIIDFELEVVDAIPVGKTGKRKVVDQRIPNRTA